MDTEEIGLVVALTGSCISGAICFWQAGGTDRSPLGTYRKLVTAAAGIVYFVELFIFSMLVLMLVRESPLIAFFGLPLLLGAVVSLAAVSRARVLLSWFLGAVLGSLAGYLFGLATIRGATMPTGQLADSLLGAVYMYFGFVLGPVVGMMFAYAKTKFIAGRASYESPEGKPPL